MSSDTNVVRPSGRRHGLDDLTGRLPTVERKRYRPQHRVPGEITVDIAPGEQSRLIRVPLPPRPAAPVNPLPEHTRVLPAPVRATAPVPPQPVHAARPWWRILGDALQALRFRGAR